MEYSEAVMCLGRKRWLAVGVLAWAGCSFALAEVAEAKGPDSYSVIVVRNPFGLKDAPPAPGPEATNPPPVKVDVKFTGITANPSGKKAWFTIPPQPGKSTTQKCFSVAEGGKENDIEVLEIDENSATVRILNAGVPVVLNFREHGLAAPATLAVPGAAPAGPPGARPPGAVPAVPAPQPGTTYVPPAAAAPAAAAQYGNQAGIDTTARTIPSRNIRTTPADAAAQAPVDPAAQYLQMKIQERLAEQRGVPLPPIPPVPGLQME